MIEFLYGLLLKLLYPTTVALVLMLASMVFDRRPALRRTFLGLALGVLLAAGNGFVVHRMMSDLEWQHVPQEPIPPADAIVILSGGVLPRTPPRTTIEVADPGDRVLHGGEMFRRGRAPVVICAGNVRAGGLAIRPQAEDMADLLGTVGVPRGAILLETESRSTYEHVVHLCPLFERRGIRRVLLVTSALHMPRALGVFRRNCPAVEYVPAATDFRTTYRKPVVWYRDWARAWPTPRSLLDFSDAAHEYVGMLYYKVRGWM